MNPMTGLGLLWYDGSKKELAVKLVPAIRRYQERFGKQPNICCIPNPGDECVIDNIHVYAITTMIQHHFWLGNSKEEEETNEDHD